MRADNTKVNVKAPPDFLDPEVFKKLENDCYTASGKDILTRLHMFGVHILRHSTRLLYTMSSDATRRATRKLPRSSKGVV